MPYLVAIILGMGLPDEDESVPILRFLDTVTEIVPQLSRRKGNIESLQQRLKFRSTGGTLHRGIGHAKRFVMHMCRGTQPLPDWLVRQFVQLFQK